MSNDTKFFKEFIQMLKKSINVMQLCRVVSYDSISQRADVQPLALKSDGRKRALIQGALVMNHCKDDIAIGKVVVVNFCDRDNDNFRGASDFSLSSDRMHNVNDAVVMGVHR